MVTRELKKRAIIKVLLKTIIQQERKADENNTTEILSFNDLANALGLTKESQCEKMYEDLGNMIENDINLDWALEQFFVAYNI